jgi:ABC-type multidrug transport system ATPase subunit
MAHVGVVPEEPDAPPELSPARLLALTERLYPRWDEAAARERLRRFAIPMATPFARLSKGQKGAVQLALALGHAPELLILDDPTLGLDVVARDQVFGEVIGELADRGTTILITTHDLAAIEGIADRVGMLREGPPRAGRIAGGGEGALRASPRAHLRRRDERERGRSAMSERVAVGDSWPSPRARCRSAWRCSGWPSWWRRPVPRALARDRRSSAARVLLGVVMLSRPPS